jgi:xanthine dehydrogenase YagT iron-sulfur-binding subunit
LDIRVGARGLSLDRFSGQTLVLAVFDVWNVERAELSSIRAELRGLGAGLVVISDAGVYAFGPDDDVEVVASTPELPAGALEAVRRDWVVGGASPVASATERVALFVIDGARTVRFAQCGLVPRGAAEKTLADGLSEAGRAMLALPPSSVRLRRRDILTACMIVGFAAALDACARRGTRTASPASAAPPPVAPSSSSGEIAVTLTVNGEKHALRIEPRVSLLDALRERLGLTGTKKGCDHGQCGACTVLVGGRRVNSCLTLAVMVEGAEITTIEGLARGGELHPLQAAFIAEDAFQCGYCTPGQIVSAAGLLRERRELSAEAVREHMSGNICRCGAYPNIVRAVLRAQKEG